MGYLPPHRLPASWGGVPFPTPPPPSLEDGALREPPRLPHRDGGGGGGRERGGPKGRLARTRRPLPVYGMQGARAAGGGRGLHAASGEGACGGPP